MKSPNDFCINTLEELVHYVIFNCNEIY